jgi:hypothetical protein
MPSYNSTLSARQATRAMSACVSPAEGAIERHGDWLEIGRDTLGKRITCQCAICSHVCMIGGEALEAGGVFCAGCASPRSATPDARSDSFAANVAGLESWGARKRHRGAS